MWRRFAEAFGVRLRFVERARFVAGSEGRMPLLPDFGSPYGMVILSHEDAHSGLPAILDGRGWGYSCVTPGDPPASEAGFDSGIEMLRDWGWTGPDRYRPDYIMHPTKMTNVLALSDRRRLDYFVRTAASRQEVWTLALRGDVLLTNTSEGRLLYVWPEEEFVKIGAPEELFWDGAYVASVELEGFLELLSELPKAEQARVAVFPSGKQVEMVVRPQTLHRRLLEVRRAGR